MMKSGASASVHDGMVPEHSFIRKPVTQSRDIQRTVVEPSPFLLKVIEMCCGRFGMRDARQPLFQSPLEIRSVPPILAVTGDRLLPVLPPYS